MNLEKHQYVGAGLMSIPILHLSACTPRLRLYKAHRCPKVSIALAKDTFFGAQTALALSAKICFNQRHLRQKIHVKKIRLLLSFCFYPVLYPGDPGYPVESFFSVYFVF
jgi:hypothetical protein